MAMSNWECMAFNTDGEPSDGYLASGMNASVEFYKNWIYVRDQEMWRQGCGWVRPVIARIDAGRIELSNFSIEAVRGPQDGVFCYAEVRYGVARDEKRRMAGIGCYAYADEWDLVRKEARMSEEEWENFSLGGRTAEDGTELIEFTFLRRGSEDDFQTLVRHGAEYKTKYVGIMGSTFDSFIEWLRGVESDRWDEEEHTEWVDKLAAQGGLRFNQGDAYFATHLGVELPVSKVGGDGNETA